MVIESFEIDGSGRVIVNGTKLMWACKKDIMPYGDDNTPYKDKFILFLEAKKAKIISEPPKKVQPKAKVPEKINSKNGKILDDETLLTMLSDKIDEYTEYYYRKYKEVLILDKNDIKQEIIYGILEERKRHEKCSGRMIRDTNIKSFTISLEFYIRTKVYYRLAHYTKNIGLPAPQVGFLMESINIAKNLDTPIEDIFNENNVDNTSLSIVCNKTLASMPYKFRAPYGVSKESLKYRLCEMYKIYKNLILADNNIYEPYSELREYIDTNYVSECENKALNTGINDNLMQVLDTLKPREKEVLLYRFGFKCNGRALTLEEIAKEFKLTPTRIRQIEAKALKKLRHPIRTKKIREWDYDY